MLHRLFVDHPSAVGETYDEHRRVALSFAFPLISAGLACLVHAFVPGLFVRTGSQTIEQLHQRMVVARRGPNRTSGEPHQDLAAPAVEA
jgi:hypothetical protein